MTLVVGVRGVCVALVFATSACALESAGTGLNARDASPDDAPSEDGPLDVHADAAPWVDVVPLDAVADAPLDVPADAPVDALVEPTDAPVDAPADAPIDAPAPPRACDNAALLAGGCTSGHCTVSATGKPLPDGAVIALAEKPVPSNLSGDVLGSVLCSVAVPDGVSSVANLVLSIALPIAPDAKAVLFQYVSPALSRTVTTSQPSGAAVAGLVPGPGDYGATEQPGAWSVSADLGVDVSSSADQASLLRNLSSQAMYNAFYDGTRLFACNGSRLLVYKGLPSSPAVVPDLVVGQPSLDTTSTATSSSLFGRGACSVPWSDGKRLAVANQNRVLIWTSMPSTSLTPADLVLGQPDFSSNGANTGGVSAAALSFPQSIDSDGTQLAVADTLNHRVLVWKSFPVSVNQPADFVIGQTDLHSNGASGGAAPMYQSWGVAFDSAGLFITNAFGAGFGLAHVPMVTDSNPQPDFVALTNAYKLVPSSGVVSPTRVVRTPTGGLAVRDYMQRVAMLNRVPTGPASIDFALGQPDTMHAVESPTSASTVSPRGTAYNELGAGANVLVPDRGRLLIYDTPPTYNFEPASRVLGQAAFTTTGPIDYRGISALTLAGPADVAAGGGLLAVADQDNSRVLLYRTSDVAAGKLAATVVLGQPDAASYVPNLDQRTPSAARLSGPAGVALDGTHLIVADTENHRVLIWSSIPTASRTPADLVLGQSDFSGRRPNRGRGDADGDGSSDADADGFFYPVGVASDGTHLFVADRLNNRVLAWNAFPTSSGQPADAVIGQPDFQKSGPNANGGPFVFAANGLNLPTGVALDGTSLWIADTANNRVVRWDDVFGASPIAAGALLGQSSGSTVSNASYSLDTETAVGQPKIPGPTGATSVLSPRGLVVIAGTLYVAESDSSRVHMFDTTSLLPAGELGQSDDSGGMANANGVGASSLAGPLGLAADAATSSPTLWVADFGNNRVVGYDVGARPATGSASTGLLGQPSYLTNGFDQASTASNGVMSQPSGVALANGQLYVADTSNNRILVFPTPVSAGAHPTRVYGQPNATLALPNSGGPPSASTFSGPHGLFADATHLVVADTGNHRVLVFDSASTTGAAVLVLGQPSFASTQLNSGAGASASTMSGPTAAFSDGSALVVSDTGNHRVLVWTHFPTSNGQPADVVLGQGSFSGTLPNRGTGAASASSLSFPSGVVVVHGSLYVADTGNNRIVSFSTLPVASGGAADGVLGQTDLTGRTSAVGVDDLAHLAGPTALAADDESLYAADRDLGRIVVYALGTLKSGVAASLLIAAPTAVPLSGPQAIAVEPTAFFTSRVYVADTGNSQIAVVQSVTRLASF